MSGYRTVARNSTACLMGVRLTSPKWSPRPSLGQARQTKRYAVVYISIICVPLWRSSSFNTAGSRDNSCQPYTDDPGCLAAVINWNTSSVLAQQINSISSFKILVYGDIVGRARAFLNCYLHFFSVWYKIPSMKEGLWSLLFLHFSP